MCQSCVLSPVSFVIPYGDFIAPDTNFEGDLSLEPSESTNSTVDDDLA